MAPPPDRPLASVDEVRAQLRRLGYLDSGLDRFVLGGVAPGGSLAAAAWRVALRVGVLGGVVFGAALSLAAAGLDRRLLAAPADLAVLALYLLVALGTASAAAAFVAALAAGWWTRRGRVASPRVSRNVGLALGLAGLGYLALWWRSHGLAAAPPVQAAAVVVGVAASLALGRFGALAAVAVLSASGPGSLPEASLTRRRMLPLLAAAALLLGGGVAAAAYMGARAAPPPPDFAVIPTGLRVRVLGVDGLDPRMAARMAEGGEMPHLRRLLTSAARARLRVEPEQVPALVWTSVATGRGPEAHGVLSIGARRLAGMRTPVALDEQGLFARALARGAEVLRLGRPAPPSAGLRGVKAFWNVASEKGLRVGVVNWWATWPAEPVHGYLVSDRALFKLEKGGPLEREVHPPELFERLRRLEDARGPAGEDERARARRMDRFHAQAARELRGAAAPDLEALYLPGLDIITVLQLDPRAADLPALDARLQAVREHYRLVDGLIGEAAAARGADEVLVLVADPGRLARRSPDAEGLLALAGPQVRPGELAPASQRDVAPTVLHLLGIPRSAELDGRVLEEALEPSFRAAHPVRRVAGYGRRVPDDPAQSEFDRAMLEELRSLGYIR